MRCRSLLTKFLRQFVEGENLSLIDSESLLIPNDDDCLKFKQGASELYRIELSSSYLYAISGLYFNNASSFGLVCRLTASLRRKGLEVSLVSLISSIQDSQALAEGRRSRSLLQSNDQDGQSNSGDKMSLSSISVSQEGANKSHSEAHATVLVHPGSDGKRHIELNALSISVDAS